MMYVNNSKLKTAFETNEFTDELKESILDTFDSFNDGFYIIESVFIEESEIDELKNDKEVYERIPWKHEYYDEDLEEDVKPTYEKEKDDFSYEIIKWKDFFILIGGICCC